jgi:glyoxylase-like metal-dependent hydrolase (beta-lactamase superfamily II)
MLHIRHTQTKALWRAIQEQFPTKPVKYVGVSHYHFDHIGGLREAAAMGCDHPRRQGSTNRFFGL